MPTVKPSNVVNARDLLLSIDVGSRVTIKVPNGIGRNGQEWKEKTGRATIVNFKRDPKNETVVLNMGGQFGTPAVCTVDNIVSIGKRIAYREEEGDEG